MGELALLQDLNDQKYEFTKLMIRVGNGPKGDDKYWVRMRNELLWLRSWGAEELSEGANGEGADTEKGRGIFGQLAKEYVETEILKALLANTRTSLFNVPIGNRHSYLSRLHTGTLNIRDLVGSHTLQEAS